MINYHSNNIKYLIKQSKSSVHKIIIFHLFCNLKTNIDSFFVNLINSLL